MSASDFLMFLLKYIVQMDENIKVCLWLVAASVYVLQKISVSIWKLGKLFPLE